MKAWNVDIEKLYGRWGWRRRRRFNLAEHLFESPDGSAAVVLFHIGEIGLDCQVGHLAVLKQKGEPRVVWRDGGAGYWYAGESTVCWRGDWAMLYECKIVHDAKGPARRHYEFRLVVLDVRQERMAVWQQSLDRAPAIRFDGSKAILDGAPGPGGGAACDLDALSWRPFGRWQG